MDWELLTLFTIIIVLLGIMAVWFRKSLLERDQAVLHDRILQASPFGVLRWTGGGWMANPSARALLAPNLSAGTWSSEEIVAGLPDGAADSLRDALDALVAEGKVFEQTLETAERSALVLVGRFEAGAHVVWIRDDTAANWLAERFTEMEAEHTLLGGILDMSPVPLWWRDAETLEIVGRNAAYDELIGGVEDGRSSELSTGQQGRELAKLALRTGSAQSESRHIVHGGTRRALSISEGPVPGKPGVIAGSALDLTALEDLQASLADHIAVQDQVLEKLSSAIVIFGPDKRLKFFNTPYSQMWNIPEKLLNEQPTHSAMLEILRERNQLPEMSDFPAYKRSMDQLFTSLIDPAEEMMHLPDGRTVRTVRSPHPLGGLIFQYEDVTDRLALESSYNTLTAVQNSTLNSLLEGVCVFGRDGRMKLFNSVYASMFGYDPEWLATAPHISDVIDTGGRQFQFHGEWESLRAYLIRSVAEPRSKSGDMQLVDGRTIRYAYIPLPDGQCLVLYMDITDTTQVEQALRERNRALENADLLKSRFISNVSYELRTPLNAILGFAELLKIGETESLSDRQEAYIDGIHSAGVTLSDIVGDMLDLAVVQAGFVSLEKEEIDLQEMLDVVASECAPDDTAMQWLIAPIEISGHPTAKHVFADRAQLKKSLTKLLSAAASITPPENKVRIVWSPERSTPEAVAFHIVPETDEQAFQDWSDLVLGSPAEQQNTNAMLDSTPRAASADLAIRLARSLIYAQQGVLTPGDEPASILCHLPAAK